MEPRNVILWILLVVLAVLAMPTGVQAQELREVPASEILEKIQTGEDVYLENVRITGEFNLCKIELETVPIARDEMVLVGEEGWEIEIWGLEDELKIVESKITIINSVFENNTDSSNTQFKKPVDFLGTSFLGISNFRGVCFGGYADFRYVSFGGDTHFSYAIFDGDADFWGASFGGDANFVSASFGGDAEFNSVEFDEVDFSNTAFSQTFLLRDADFKTLTPNE